MRRLVDKACSPQQECEALWFSSREKSMKGKSVLEEAKAWKLNVIAELTYEVTRLSNFDNDVTKATSADT